MDNTLELRNKFRSEKEKLTFALIFTAIWGLIAHGFCYFNVSYSHDSMYIFQNDVEWQISIGRFLHPLYFKLRGNIFTPSLVGFLSLLFIGLSVYVVCKLLNTENKLKMCLISGIMTANATITLLNATYIHDIDIYALSLLFAVLAVYVCRNCRLGVLWAALLTFLSVGLYQSFFQVSIFLFMIMALRDLLMERSFKEVFSDGIKAIGALLAGLIIYYAVLKIVLHTTGIQLSESDNGLSNVGNMGGLSAVLGMVVNTYRRVIEYFRWPRIYHSILMGMLNILLALVTAFFVISIVIKKKIKGKELALLFALIALMPFGMNVICFISQGMAHDLTIYSFFFVYILIYEIAEIWLDGMKSGTLRKAAKCVVPLALAVILFNSVIFSNQLYLKKDFEYQSTMQTMNRITARMEETEGYVLGETPVAIIGSLSESDMMVSREGFEGFGTGTYENSSLTYYKTYEKYFDFVAGYPVILLEEEEALKLAETEEIQSMSCFPDIDSCRIVDGTMVVKLSEG